MGKTYSLRPWFPALRDLIHKTQNIIRRHLVEFDVPKLWTKFCNGKIVSPNSFFFELAG